VPASSRPSAHTARRCAAIRGRSSRIVASFPSWHRGEPPALSREIGRIARAWSPAGSARCGWGNEATMSNISDAGRPCRNHRFRLRLQSRLPFVVCMRRCRSARIMKRCFSARFLFPAADTHTVANPLGGLLFVDQNVPIAAVFQTRPSPQADRVARLDPPASDRWLVHDHWPAPDHPRDMTKNPRVSMTMAWRPDRSPAAWTVRPAPEHRRVPDHWPVWFPFAGAERLPAPERRRVPDVRGA